MHAMRARHIEAILRQIYRGHATSSPAHQAELEGRLTASFRSSPGPGIVLGRKRTIARRFGVAAMVCGTALAASQLPVRYSIRVGERLTISVRRDEPVPQPNVLMPILQQAGSTVARVQTRREASGVVVVAQLWGETLAGGLARQVRAAYPAARVSVRPMQGGLRGTVLDKLRYELLDIASPQQIAQARAAVMKELATRGEKATVEISEGEIAARPQPRILVRVHGRRPGVTQERP